MSQNLKAWLEKKPTNPITLNPIPSNANQQLIRAYHFDAAQGPLDEIGIWNVLPRFYKKPSSKKPASIDNSQCPSGFTLGNANCGPNESPLHIRHYGKRCHKCIPPTHPIAIVPKGNNHPCPPGFTLGNANCGPNESPLHIRHYGKRCHKCVPS
ncbi:hypothetical protein HOM50_05450 [bacterium]|jgi:hypothetical protein|nr:hypothetical protein [bacterium]MBT5015825.1 hypothetical protein [bacterium]